MPVFGYRMMKKKQKYFEKIVNNGLEF